MATHLTLSIPLRQYRNGMSNHDCEIFAYYEQESYEGRWKYMSPIYDIEGKSHTMSYDTSTHHVWLIYPSITLHELDELWYQAIHENIFEHRRWCMGYEIKLGERVLYSYDEWLDRYLPNEDERRGEKK